MSALDEIRKLLQEDAKAKEVLKGPGVGETDKAGNACLLYTSDAADDAPRV